MGVWGWLMEQTPGQGCSRASVPNWSQRLEDCMEARRLSLSTSVLLLSVRTDGLFVTQPHGGKRKLPSASEFKRATNFSVPIPADCLSSDWDPPVDTSVSKGKGMLGRRGCCHIGWMRGEESPETHLGWARVRVLWDQQEKQYGGAANVEGQSLLLLKC